MSHQCIISYSNRRYNATLRRSIRQVPVHYIHIHFEYSCFENNCNYDSQYLIARDTSAWGFWRVFLVTVPDLQETRTPLTCIYLPNLWHRYRELPQWKNISASAGPICGLKVLAPATDFSIYNSNIWCLVICWSPLQFILHYHLIWESKRCGTAAPASMGATCEQSYTNPSHSKSLRGF